MACRGELSPTRMTGLRKEIASPAANAQTMSQFTQNQLHEAWSQLPERLKNTPLVPSRTPGLYLKLETLQPTGSYKIRAAYTRLKARKRTTTEMALSSSGNFAAAFAWAADQLKIRPHLVVTPQVNQKKMELAKRFPCQIHVCGARYESRFETLSKLESKGVETIDHRTCETVFLGHSTIGWELLSETQKFDRVLIPVSTGGLAIGVAAALRAGGYSGEILGVQSSGNPTLHDSWKAGRPIPRHEIETVCDALSATSIPNAAFKLLQDLLDDVLMVEESSVLPAVGYFLEEEGLVVEPGAAVGLAALLELQRPWKRTLLILTGSVISQELLFEGLKQYRALPG